MKTQSLAGYHDMLLYYKQLNIIADEKEFEEFSQCLLKELPINFRINKTRSYWKVIEKKFLDISEGIKKDTGVLPLRKLDILGEEIFKFEISNQDLKKNPSFNPLHKILLEEALMNNIFRQESVSMLPVSLLNINHESSYLDMCAAPGSKTIQIVEKMVISQLENKAKGVTGFVVANELDSQRSNMLAFQTIKIPQNFLMITNQDACTLPDKMKFDKILCDVPCSGDGTIRKNDMIKKGWSYKYGIKLHPLQLRILVKGLNMLNEGGELVYSTCSLNPVEDESVVLVVNQALNLFGEDLELIDISDRFQDFKIKKGIKDWKVYFKRGKKELNQDWFENYEQVIKMKRNDKITNSMFPNNSQNNPLERTVRILPHQNDTGGFYIALFRKKSNKTVPLPDLLKNDEEEKSDTQNQTEASEEKPLTKEDEEAKTEIVSGNELIRYSAKFVDEWISTKKFYSISDNYDDDLYFLNKGQKRLLYINQNLYKFVTECGDSSLRIVSIGMKVFERLKDEECETGFRILNEALYWMLSEIKAQILTVTVDIFSELVSSFDSATQKLQTDEIKHGPFIVTTKARDMALIGWKGRKRLTLLIGKEELHYLSYFLKSNFYTLE